jgi:tRNA(Ile2) C34 agmatinyltransferase TiaS
MAKNTAPPTCPKCGKPMRFMLVKSGGRKFRCIDCEVPDPLKTPEIKKLLIGELKKPPE